MFVELKDTSIKFVNPTKNYYVIGKSYVPQLEQEMKKLLAAFQKSSSEEEHSTLADTLHHSGVNVFTLCAGGGGSCLLAALYRWGEVHVSSEYLEKCPILFRGETDYNIFFKKCDTLIPPFDVISRDFVIQVQV